LLAEHHLLVFSGELTADEHVALVSCFGRVLPQGPRIEVNDRPAPPLPVVTYVSNDRAKGDLASFELGFHHDLAHVANPLAGLSLYAVEMDATQTATRFASGARAYTKLRPELRDRIGRLQALFSANYSVTSERPVSAREARASLDPTWPRVVHPVVVAHPVTGVPCLYLNAMMTVEILGLATKESDDLLDELFAVLYEPSNVYEHRWRAHDLVIWDNLALQHARDRIVEDTPRTLRRVVFGDRAPWEAWPNSPEA
jgi:taurine dioxygenase